MDALRQHLEALLAGQPEHPVYPPVGADWAADYGVGGCTMVIGEHREELRTRYLALGYKLYAPHGVRFTEKILDHA